MIRIGCIADDFTGATDLASNLVRGGMRVAQTIGLPSELPAEVDAVVVALKSRTAPASEAVRDSVLVADWLRRQGASLIYFKICSTFDSTAQGNIGPVTEALMDLLGEPFVPVTPAFPENGRTVFNGHLFVDGRLLSESPLRHHPLTPMCDSDLVRVLQSQLHGLPPRVVSLVDHRCVARGAAAIQARMQQMLENGSRISIVDATDDADLRQIAIVITTQELPLVVAGSGLATGLCVAHGFKPSQAAGALPMATGWRAIVSGSCSERTEAQVAAFIAAGGEAFAVDPVGAPEAAVAAAAMHWAERRLGRAPLLFHTLGNRAIVRSTQASLGAEAAGVLIESILARIAVGLVERGVGQLVVAGGETSGACVRALGIRELRVGDIIDPGVPWCHASRVLGTKAGLHIALKSGNFGSVDMFRKAFDLLERAA
jgi:uncharacterized protein YgbK (DUF1537 family)